MKIILALVLSAVAVQATPLGDIMVRFISRLTDQSTSPQLASKVNRPGNQRPLTAQQCANKLKSVQQSRLAGWTRIHDDSRIINGSPAQRDQFPWQVYMYSNNGFACAGSIISNTWILTAAHCVTGATRGRLLLGTNNRVHPQPEALIIDYLDIVTHNAFNNVVKRNDIALLKLSAPIAFNNFMSSVKLPSRSFASESLVGVNLTVSGWGATVDGGNVSDTLNFADVLGISNTDCEAYYKLITDSQLCTLGKPVHGSCHGDNGGPLVVKGSDGLFTQVGVASYSHPSGCSKGPSVFTRVTSFLDWIEAKTGIVIEP